MATLFLMLIYLTFISLGLPDSLLGAAWPAMRVDLGAGLDAAGLVSLVVSAGTIVSSLLSGRVIRRFGTGRVTAVSVLATAAALLAAGFGQSLLWMVLAAVPLGLGAGAVDAALNNYVALHYAPRHMSWLHSFWGVGAFTGPLIMGAFLGREAGWRGGYFVIACIQFVVSALLFLSLPLWKKREGEALAAEAEQEAGQAAFAGPAIRMPGVVPALLTFLLYCAAEYTVGLWGSSFLLEQRGFDEAGAAGAVAIYYGGITVGRMLTGFLTFKLSGRALIRVGGVLLTLGAVLFALPLPWVMNLGGLLLMGLGCAPVYPSMIQETPRRFGAANSQKVIGWQMAAAYTGTTVVPPLVGLVAQRAGMGVLPGFMIGYGVLMLLCSEWIEWTLRSKSTG